MIYSIWGDPIEVISYNEKTEWVEYKYIEHPDSRSIKNHKDTLKADGGWREIEEKIRRLK